MKKSTVKIIPQMQAVVCQDRNDPKVCTVKTPEEIANDIVARNAPLFFGLVYSPIIIGHRLTESPREKPWITRHVTIQATLCDQTIMYHPTVTIMMLHKFVFFLPYLSITIGITKLPTIKLMPKTEAENEKKKILDFLHEILLIG